MRRSMLLMLKAVSLMIEIIFSIWHTICLSKGVKFMVL